MMTFALEDSVEKAVRSFPPGSPTPTTPSTQEHLTDGNNKPPRLPVFAQLSNASTQWGRRRVGVATQHYHADLALRDLYINNLFYLKPPSYYTYQRLIRLVTCAIREKHLRYLGFCVFSVTQCKRSTLQWRERNFCWSFLRLFYFFNF